MGICYNIFSIYPQVKGKKSNFFVPVCINPNDSYHFLNTLFSSTIPMLTFTQSNFWAVLKAWIKSSWPIFLSVRFYSEFSGWMEQDPSGGQCKGKSDPQQLCIYEKLLVGLAEAVEDWWIQFAGKSGVKKSQHPLWVLWNEICSINWKLLGSLHRLNINL